MKIGFDNEKYLTMQSEHIKKRIGEFGDKLYLEFGGKLFDDFHAFSWPTSPRLSSSSMRLILRRIKCAMIWALPMMRMCSA